MTIPRKIKVVTLTMAEGIQENEILTSKALQNSVKTLIGPHGKDWYGYVCVCLRTGVIIFVY